MPDTNYIPLSTDRNNPGGLCPHLTVCTRCGEETNALTIGELWKAKYQNQYVYFYRRDRRKIEKQLNHQFRDDQIQRVGEFERVPFGVCEACETELETYKQIVSDGGVYFECTECRRSGVIKASDFTREIRERNNIPAPNPIGVRFDSCQQHN